MLKFVILVLFGISYSCGQTANYCATNLCSNKKHIACNNNGAFSSTCLAGRSMVNITSLRAAIIEKHNSFRNQIAGGKLPGFKPAVRMATMQWDAELEKLAALNVKQCAMKHDACRNTDRFKWSGQNLAWRWGVPAPTPQVVVTKGMESWFNEYKDAKQANVDKYQSTTAVIGHFTAMVNDRNTRLGCAMSKQPKNNGMEFFFACNYAQTNVLSKPIYISGTAASKCTKGKNAKYPALCAASEPINPNLLP